ncbi:MAG: ABC transporter ATP-binding protein [Parvularculaceae bacterium]|nr:ABC transporter ATP-binding protein [Parvularculaceae bacterium]
MNGPVLEVIDQRTAFETSRGLLRAVDGVSLTLHRGRTLGIVGESGCGKSILARSIMRLLPRTARIGPGSQLLFEGEDLMQASEHRLRAIRGRHMAIVFQDPMTSLNPVMTVGAQIAESLTHHLGMSRHAAWSRATALLADVGLPQPEMRVSQYPHQLSGGMRQRVAIAIALACEPSLLIADEPTTALDVTVQADILDLLQRQQRERNMAMILITHDLGVVASRTDEVAVMYAGRIVEQAPTRALFKSARMPYTHALLGSIPRLEAESRGRLAVIEGRPPDLIRPPPGCSFAPRCSRAGARCRLEPPQLTGEGSHSFSCWNPLPAEAAA